MNTLFGKSQIRMKGHIMGFLIFMELFRPFP